MLRGVVNSAPLFSLVFTTLAPAGCGEDLVDNNCSHHNELASANFISRTFRELINIS